MDNTDLRAFGALYDEKNFRTIDQHEDEYSNSRLSWLFLVGARRLGSGMAACPLCS
jgi:hypothetical protein